MITSSNNAKVKQVVQWQTKAKERRKDHVFLAEGVRMCEEAPVKSVREVYLTEELEQKLRRNAQNGDTAFWDKLQQTGYETVSPEVFAKMADTQTPQGILTVLEQPSYDLTHLPTCRKHPQDAEARKCTQEHHHPDLPESRHEHHELPRGERPRGIHETESHQEDEGFVKNPLPFPYNLYRRERGFFIFSSISIIKLN